MLNTKDLPFSLNPPNGFLASANNRPANTSVRVGYFFSPDDRVNRMSHLVEIAGKLEVDQVRDLQKDVHVESSAALNALLVKRMRDGGVGARAEGKRREVLELLVGWDGSYDAGSRGALAFELFRHAFATAFYASTFGKADGAAFAASGRIKALMLEDIERTDDKALAAPLRDSLAKAAGDLDGFSDWGDMHRLRLAHPLALLPVIGKRFRFADHPAAGTTEAVMKTAHRSTDTRHAVSYGSNARHISDLSDMDRNEFVLLGGQDGWINSTTFQDQVPLWIAGEYIQMPMRPHTVRARFRHKMDLSS
jgi:penicillin amidase